MANPYFYDERNRTRPTLPMAPQLQRRPDFSELTVDPFTGQAVIPAGGMQSPFQPRTRLKKAEEFARGEVASWIDRLVKGDVDPVEMIGGATPAGPILRAGRMAGSGLHPKMAKGYAAELQRGMPYSGPPKLPSSTPPPALQSVPPGYIPKPYVDPNPNLTKQLTETDEIMRDAGKWMKWHKGGRRGPEPTRPRTPLTDYDVLPGSSHALARGPKGSGSKSTYPAHDETFGWELNQDVQRAMMDPVYRESYRGGKRLGSGWSAHMERELGGDPRSLIEGRRGMQDPFWNMELARRSW